MSVEEIKKKLHKVIDTIDDEEVLQAMLTILAQGGYRKKEYKLSEDQIRLLEEREEEYLKGEGKSQTLEEFKKEMNKKYGL